MPLQLTRLILRAGETRTAGANGKRAEKVLIRSIQGATLLPLPLTAGDP